MSETSVNQRKVAMIGCGFVGSATAFALMESGLFSEMVLIDADKIGPRGEALDISHGLPFTQDQKIYAGDYDDIVDAAIIIVTSANQKPDETRLDLVRKMLVFSNPSFRNYENCRRNPADRFQSGGYHNLHGIEIVRFPGKRVFGSGTVLRILQD